MDTSPGNRRIALVISCVTAFLTAYMGSSVNVALPTIGREFGLSAVALTWVTTAFLLAAAASLVPLGRLADIHGRKKFFLYGVGLYTASSLLCAQAPSAAVLIAFRVVQGLAAAMIFGTGVAILTSIYPAPERGRALGINIACVYSGLSLGPVLGGVLTQHLGWRSIFITVVPLGLISIALTLWRLKGEWAESRGEQFDLTGTAVYSLMFIALMGGLSLLPSRLGAWLLLTGLAGAAAFLWWEGSAENAILDIRLFRGNRVFALSNLAAMLNYSATYAIGFLLSLYLQYIKALTPEQAGGILLAQPVMQAAFAPFAGRLSDRIEPRRIASVGMALTAAGLVVLGFARGGTSLAVIAGSLIIVGAGFGLFSPPNTNAIMGSVESRAYGVASGTLATMRLSGQMFSMGLLSLIFSLFMGRTPITPARYGLFLAATSTAFHLFALLCFCGIFASLARGETRRAPIPSRT